MTSILPPYQKASPSYYPFFHPVLWWEERVTERRRARLADFAVEPPAGWYGRINDEVIAFYRDLRERAEGIPLYPALNRTFRSFGPIDGFYLNRFIDLADTYHETSIDVPACHEYASQMTMLAFKLLLAAETNAYSAGVTSGHNSSLTSLVVDLTLALDRAEEAVIGAAR